MLGWPQGVFAVWLGCLLSIFWKPEKDPAFSRKSVRVSAELKTVYSKIAGKRGHLFLAAEDYVSPSRFDDEHINAEGHGILAEAIYRTLTDSFLQTG